jgi:hypothetical protein
MNTAPRLDQPPVARAGRNHSETRLPSWNSFAGATTKAEVYPVVYWPDRIRIVPLISILRRSKTARPVFKTNAANRAFHMQG